MLALPPDRSPWATYTLCILTYGMPYIHAVFVAMTSRNAGSVRTRTVAAALYNMCVQSSTVIAINVSSYDERNIHRVVNAVSDDIPDLP